MIMKKEKQKFRIKQLDILDLNRIITNKKNSLNLKDISNHQNKETIKMNGENWIKKQLMKKCKNQKKREEMRLYLNLIKMMLKFLI